ncbi:MAG: hypothetical protein EZS28_008441 [Streblomastix strix]|uniref:Uncharacterized protein n=1 Tax=Streblomastix strix TaxID=222440 RepID=A0A5J4WPC0_9EUKA|nr:MAG: hypothetical protein EZS28_008441 [Streblomastix strix]
MDVKVSPFILSVLVKYEDFDELPELPESVILPENPNTSIRIVRSIEVTLRIDGKYLKYQKIESKMQMQKVEEYIEDVDE